MRVQCVRAREIKHAHKPQQAVEREAALGETEAELQGEMEARAAFADAAMEAMLAAGIDYDIFFYNPNIHPVNEYEIRKNENIRFAQAHGIRFIDADHPPHRSTKHVACNSFRTPLAATRD